MIVVLTLWNDLDEPVEQTRQSCDSDGDVDGHNLFSVLCRGFMTRMVYLKHDV